MDQTPEIPEITTDRLILRNWRPGDIEPFAAMNADARVMEFFPATLNMAQSELVLKFVRSHFDTHGFSFWVIEDRASGEFAGLCGFMSIAGMLPFAPCVEFAVRMPIKFWGSGLATEASAALLDHGLDALQLPEIVAYTSVDNIRSRRLLERIGMVRDTDADFINPILTPDHRLQPFVLYRARAGRDAANDNRGANIRTREEQS